MYDQQIERFATEQARQGSKERQERLKEGLGHGAIMLMRSVWLPAVGHLEDLYPEYEVYDFKDGVRFLDFAYLREPHKVAIEVDGFGPHGRDASRWQFADDRIRQNHLVIDGWKVIRFAYDDIAEKPRRCQQIVQQFMGKWYGMQAALPEIGLLEKELLRFAIRRRAPFAVSDACDVFQLSDRHIRTMLHRLVDKGLLQPASGSALIRSYSIHPNAAGYHL